MFDKWHKKEKPVFTGISRGMGGFSFGVPSAGGGGSTAGGGSASGATLTPLVNGVTDGDFKFFGFTAPGTFTVTGSPVYADILVIGGGGGGAGAPDGNGGGGGGAGGVVLMPGIELEAGTYPVTVGGGGSGNAPNDDNSRHGSPSTFGSSPSPTYVIAGGGGRGAQGVSGPNTDTEANGAGSGGGGAGPSPGPFRVGYAGQIGDNPGTGRLVKEYANPGSDNDGNASSGGWGGGGGAGSLGNTGPSGGAGRGGAFTRINEFPAPVTEPLIPAPTRSAWTAAVGPQGCFGAGGGGGAWNHNNFTPRSGYPNSIPGGKGGYGNASPGSGTQGTAGVEFTGSGGGGSGVAPPPSWAGGDGGDGIVLIRQVVKTGFSFISATGGDFNDTRGGYKYHYFTTTGPQTFTIDSGKGMVEYFAVGGGGGGGGAPTGGADGGGGGGAGGVIEGSVYCEPGPNTFVIGAGGATNENGVDTTCFGLTAMKGGSGSSGPGQGAGGGSGVASGGGGSAAGNSGGAQNPGAADPSNQGYRGGGSAAGGGPGGGGAGGGGAGGDGASSHGPWGFRDSGADGLANGSNTYGGPGGYGVVCGFPLPNSYGGNIPSDQSRGNGYPSAFRGFAGGGGGGNWTSMPERGHGGMGNRVVNNGNTAPYFGGGSGANQQSHGSAGVNGTGGGGGGGGYPGYGGYSGGSGIVIVRYQVS
tara:strand:+ start:839 stop:2923 length:2085 start_codon:yes stop_codon:yes gene_type:complete